MTLVSNVIAVLAFFLMPANTTLYTAALEPIVELPAGYFVVKTDEPAPDGYISVAYDDLTGLVKASDVTAVDYTPVNKYETTVTFRCDNDGQPVNLRAAPRRSAEVLAVLPASATGRAYGSARGDAIIKNGDTLWYYVKADGVRGYVYYAHAEVTDTPPNIIEKEPEEPDTPASADPEEQISKPPLPTAAVIVLIVTLCLPVPFIMYYMFKKPKDRD